MSSLALYLLGLPRVERDGAPVRLRRRKAVALLAYLAVSGQRHGRDALATLLWPEFDQQRARAGLRVVLSSLRESLGEDALEVDRESVALGANAGLWLDVSEFRERLVSCEGHGHPPEEPCPSCVSALTAAVAVYGDDFLAGFTLPDSPTYDEW